MPSLPLRRPSVIMWRSLFFSVINRLVLYSLSPLVFVLTKTSRGLPLFSSKKETSSTDCLSSLSLSGTFSPLLSLSGALYSLSPLVFVLTKTSRGLPLFFIKSRYIDACFHKQDMTEGGNNK